ncbi:MAG: hypothetical protein JWN43_1456 [Gammaproteobacteria bacterium]|nr:hypothetical protein [Gammaproteobacteria bacterium]
MNADHTTLSHHPPPHRERGTAAAMAFGLLGGPAAWFGQLCAGFALSSWPCFPNDQLMRVPISGFSWTGNATGLVSLAALAIALAAMFVSQRLLQRTRDEDHGGHAHLAQIGAGRTRFLALWGTIAGGAFAVATAFTGVAFFILPRCAG